MQSTTTQGPRSAINNNSTYHEPYSSEERVALYMLNSAFNDGGKKLTPLQINKMVYISHGWILGVFEKPLINNSNNQIQAWKYGPVVVGLYHLLKSFGNRFVSVNTFLEEISWSRGVYDVRLSLEHSGEKNPVMEIPALEKFKRDYPEVAKGLNWVYENYVRYSGEQLITLTHRKGSPWYEVYHDRKRTGLLDRWGLTSGANIPIPDVLIMSHYRKRVNGHPRA